MPWFLHHQSRYYGRRARKIQAELSKLGIRVSLATVSRYVPKAGPGPRQRQRWTTFLWNHQEISWLQRADE